MKQKIITPIAIVVSGLIVAWAIMSGTDISPANKNTDKTIVSSQENVSVSDGKQIIEISAKGGYSPKKTTAKAGIPTLIKMRTNSTFDCSSALVIPSINYKKNLPFSGDTLIEIPPQKEGTVMRGLCSMGMYSFEINFQ